ncbi:LuxR C-terminal-related transcriptional regulator [Faecalibacterium prausnitzii]
MNKKEIAETLRDYNWIINEIKRQRKLIEDVNGNFIAQYGVEASLPKVVGQNGDPIFQEVVRREKKSKWIERLEKKVLYIQSRIDRITDERERAVLECILDGMSMQAISRHMGLSTRHIQRIKNSIVDQMSDMSDMSQKMTGEIY